MQGVKVLLNGLLNCEDYIASVGGRWRKYECGALVECWEMERPKSLKKKSTSCGVTLSTTNPTRTHKRLPSDSMYHNLKLKNTVTLVDQTVVCLTNEIPGWKIKKKKNRVSNPKTSGNFLSTVTFREVQRSS
jgi:hypothetical protein